VFVVGFGVRLFWGGDYWYWCGLGVGEGDLFVFVFGCEVV